MNIDVRKHIINNFKDSSVEDINEAIESGISSKEEVVLPGLGVFFEILWNNADESHRQLIKETIKKGLQM